MSLVPPSPPLPGCVGVGSPTLFPHAFGRESPGLINKMDISLRLQLSCSTWGGRDFKKFALFRFGSEPEFLFHPPTLDVSRLLVSFEVVFYQRPLR